MLLRGSIGGLILLLVVSQVAYALMQPCGILGRVKIDGIYQDGIQVTIKNLNTGEEKVVTTQEVNGEHGWYVATLSGDDGQILQIEYDGYTNQTTVDLEKLSQYLNLTITTESGGEEESSEPSSPSPPPPPPPPPMIKANFTYYPENPKVGEEVTFVDTSEGDISSRTWTIDGNTYTTETVTYTFTLPGYYTVSLVVMSSIGDIDIAQRTIFIKPSETSLETNETNISQETEKTNITLFILVKDKNNQTIPNAKVEIYQNNTIVQVVYTNETGTAQAILPPGSYKIKAYYGTQIETKRMDFVSDGRVTFLFNPEEIQPESEGGFDWFAVIPPVVIGIVVVVLVLLVVKDRRRKWWK